MTALREAFDAVKARREEHATDVRGETIGEVYASVQDRGAAWLTRLSDDAGVDPVDVLDLAQALADETSENLLALHFVGTLTPRELCDACVAAGFASGLFVGIDAERRRS